MWCMKQWKVLLSVSRVLVKSRFCNTQPSVSQNALAREKLHVPVMAKEVLYFLNPQPGQVFVDMTFGAGGHATHILEAAPNVTVFCLDRDPTAYSLAKNLEVKFPKQVVPLLGKFSDLPGFLRSHGVKFNSVDGFLFDLGCSSMQFDFCERGFSLSQDGPLDMRMDQDRVSNQPTAADVLAQVTEEELVKILKIYGEEKKAKKIARAIIEARYLFKRLKTTKELADLVASVFECEDRQDKLQRSAHVATKTFQALRIFVNNEINELNYAMLIAHRYIKIGGKIVTLSFHSLEDRVVKRHLCGNVIENAVNPLSQKFTDPSVWLDKEEIEGLSSCKWYLMNKHVVTPTEEEISLNPRSRSARLRAALKVE